MTTFEKLADKIKKDLGITLVDFKRTYAGIHQRASGAFVWVAFCPDTKEDVGSTISASELLKKGRVEEMERPTLSHLCEFI